MTPVLRYSYIALALLSLIEKHNYRQVKVRENAKGTGGSCDMGFLSTRIPNLQPSPEAGSGCKLETLMLRKTHIALPPVPYAYNIRWLYTSRATYFRRVTKFATIFQTISNDWELNVQIYKLGWRYLLSQCMYS